MNVLPQKCRENATAKERQKSSKNPAMQTLEVEVIDDQAQPVEAIPATPVNTFTLLQLHWEFNQYRWERLGKKPLKERAFRYWRQILEIEPDRFGLFWLSDLERLKDAARRVSGGQPLEKVAAMYKSMEEQQQYAYC